MAKLQLSNDEWRKKLTPEQFHAFLYQFGSTAILAQEQARKQG